MNSPVFWTIIPTLIIYFYSTLLTSLFVSMWRCVCYVYIDMGRKFGKEATEQGYGSINDHTASGVRQPNSVSPTATLWNKYYYDSHVLLWFTCCIIMISMFHMREQTHRRFLKLVQYRSKSKRKDTLLLFSIARASSVTATDVCVHFLFLLLKQIVNFKHMWLRCFTSPFFFLLHLCSMRTWDQRHWPNKKDAQSKCHVLFLSWWVFLGITWPLVLIFY